MKELTHPACPYTFIPEMTAKTQTEKFAGDLLRQTAPEEGNFVVSPRSVADALGLLARGARGETFAEILEALSFEDGGEMRRELAAAAMAIRKAAGSGARCETDTSLWIRRGLPLQPKFLENVRSDFGAEIAEITMDESGRQTINGHVSKATHGMIPELLAEPPKGDLVATNAVWFKGSWASEFTPELTRKGVFHAPRGKIRVPFMRQEEWFPFVEADRYEAARLPYEGGEFALDLILPRPGIPVAAIECVLDDVLAQTRAGFEGNEGVLLDMALPKCDIDGSHDLATPLRRMGAGRIFSPERADFLGIVDTADPFWVNQIIHQARIRLDEKGTEAAAATAISCPAGCPPPLDRPRPFRANRPFLFALRVVETEDILFCGRVANPEV